MFSIFQVVCFHQRLARLIQIFSWKTRTTKSINGLSIYGVFLKLFQIPILNSYNILYKNVWSFWHRYSEIWPRKIFFFGYKYFDRRSYGLFMKMFCENKFTLHIIDKGLKASLKRSNDLNWVNECRKSCCPLLLGTLTFVTHLCFTYSSI